MKIESVVGSGGWSEETGRPRPVYTAGVGTLAQPDLIRMILAVVCWKKIVFLFVLKFVFKVMNNQQTILLSVKKFPNFIVVKIL